MFAQHRTRILIQRFDFIGNIGAVQNAQRLNQLKCKSTGKPRQSFVIFDSHQRFEQGINFAINKVLQSALHLICDINACFFINKYADPWAQWIIARQQFANCMFPPHQAALIREINFRIWRIIELISAQMEMRDQGLHRC